MISNHQTCHHHRQGPAQVPARRQLVTSRHKSKSDQNLDLIIIDRLQHPVGRVSDDPSQKNSTPDLNQEQLPYRKNRGLGLSDRQPD